MQRNIACATFLGKFGIVYLFIYFLGGVIHLSIFQTAYRYKMICIKE